MGPRHIGEGGDVRCARDGRPVGLYFAGDAPLASEGDGGRGGGRAVRGRCNRFGADETLCLACRRESDATKYSEPRA